MIMKDKDTGYQAVGWNEPIIYEFEGRNVNNNIIPAAEDEIKESVGDVTSKISPKMRRKSSPNLPRLSEPQIARHYIRLSQQTFGVDSGSMLGLGTCTMKYNPKFSEQLARSPKAADVHPLQDEKISQGYLELLYNLKKFLCEISGMDEFSLQPRGGAHAVYTNACIIREYHKMRDQLDQKNEIITTVLSHPCNAGAPAMAGFNVVNLYPDEETGVPDMEAFKEALSEKTAGLMITDPYDTGKYDDNLEEYIDMIHEVGGLVAVDQANFNGVIGKLRIGDIGADLCHFNLHKTFGAPHGSYGPASAPVGAKEELEELLPVPSINFDGDKYYLNYKKENSIGKVAGFQGTAPALLKAYAWIRRMGAEGLEEAAEMAVINNNYLLKKLLEVKWIDISYQRDHRIQEARMSLQKMKEDTGVGTEDVNRRIVDYGVSSYFESHHPWIVSEPFTPEPTESAWKEELDRWAEIMKNISDEAYSNPEIVKSAPHKAPIGRIDESPLSDPNKAALTWRAYLKKYSD